MKTAEPRLLEMLRPTNATALAGGATTLPTSVTRHPMNATGPVDSATTLPTFVTRHPMNATGPVDSATTQPPHEMTPVVNGTQRGNTGTERQSCATAPRSEETRALRTFHGTETQHQPGKPGLTLLTTVRALP